MALHASCVVQVDFDGDGSWVDVSEFARSASWRRGRSNEFESVNAGRARVVLSNADRRFDPEYASGPFYGKLKPRKRIRIGMAYADGNSYGRFGASRELTAYTYWQFYGYVDGWPQSYNGPNDATVEVSATDAFGRWARSHLPSVWQQTIEAAANKTAWYRLGESSGTQAADSSGNKRHATYQGGATFNSRNSLVVGDTDNAIAFDGIDDYVALPFSVAVDTNAAFSIEFWIEMPEAVGANDQIIYEQSQGQATDAPGVVSILVRGTAVNDGQLNVAFISSGTSAILDSGVRVDDGARHHGVVTADGSFLSLFVDGTLVAGPSAYTALSSPVSWLRIADGKIGSGVTADGFKLTATLDEVVIYSAALSASDVAAHYDAGTAPWEGDTAGGRLDRILDYIEWPEADRDLDITSASLIPATLDTNALDHAQSVETSEGGRLFVSRDGKATLVGRQNMWAEAVYNTSNATFGDGAGELGYAMRTGDLFDYDDSKIVNDARIRQYGGSEQAASDATSQDDYGLMSRNEVNYDARPGVVLSRAEYLVYKHKDPAVRVPTVTLKPERDPDSYYPVLLAADLGYRYTVKRRPQNVGSAISKEVHLEGVAWSVTPGSVEATFELSPGEPEFWILDTSTLETGTHIARLAY